MNDHDASQDSTKEENIFTGNDLLESNIPHSERNNKIFKQDKNEKNLSTVFDHVTTLTDEPYLYKCNICSSKLKTKASIKFHEFCQSGEKPYKCEKCGQGFQLKAHYDFHMSVRSGECPFVCHQCGTEFTERGNLIQHLQTHSSENPLLGEHFDSKFTNFQARQTQLLTQTGKRPFECKLCQKCFTGATILKRHLATHAAQRTFTCSYCGDSFPLKHSFDSHVQTHFTERPFGCNQCRKAFTNKKDLLRHIIIHSGERPFKCRLCETYFRRKDNLDRHIQHTHSKSKEVAKQLADRAAADYFAKRQSSSSKHIPIHDVMKSSSRTLPDEMGVVITAELSPPGSPMADDNSTLDQFEGNQNVVQETKPLKGGTSSAAVMLPGDKSTDCDANLQYFHLISSHLLQGASQL
ncbi:unnamed protein product [Allacma fusca]|uniref:C2H2-type domain-containing protein n=1 Tax=Allacma fusca TaxID=39272 RepID=A0A8J2JL76_9HEXA|nr:unnamed protein product [Allacma fusca]